jgi:hypothetical protein
MCSSRWPLAGSRQSGHGQLSRSQTAGMPTRGGLVAWLGMGAPFLIGGGEILSRVTCQKVPANGRRRVFADRPDQR